MVVTSPQVRKIVYKTKANAGLADLNYERMDRIGWHQLLLAHGRIPGLLLALALAALGGCQSGGSKPNLHRLYQLSADNPGQPPVVFVHGAFGSKLRDRQTGEEVWPGSWTNMLFGDHHDLALTFDKQTLQPVQGNLEPYALFEAYAGQDFYGEIIDTLTGPGSYELSSAGTNYGKGNTRRLYIFLYDWRRSISHNAARLSRFIEQIKDDLADDNLKVDLVAHSMGSLITRYYLRFGGKDIFEVNQSAKAPNGVSNVRKVVMLGPPNLGSIKGLQNQMKGWQLGLRHILPDLFVTWPGAYQLMPHPDRDWMIDIHGRKFERSLYDPTTWEDLGWGIFDPSIRRRIRERFDTVERAETYLDDLEGYFRENLKRARKLHHALSRPFDHGDVRYIVFGGDCELTPARCLVEEVDGQPRLRLHPSEIRQPRDGVNYEQLMLEPGDGSVTKASAIARNTLDPSVAANLDVAVPLDYSVFLCEDHGHLAVNANFQDNLLNVLLIQKTTADRVE